jgi:hypothetical protein
MIGDGLVWIAFIVGLVGIAFIVGLVGISALISFAFYFLPSIIAGVRGTRRQDGIFLLNLLFGWTLVGWGVALIWAACEDAS